MPLFKIESESKTDHSEVIQNVLRRKVSHDPTFGVYQDDTDGSFKVGSSSFKCSDKHVDDRNYKANQELWKLLKKSKPDKNAVTFQDRQAYKQILLQSNSHKLIIALQLRSKPTRVLNIRRLFQNSLPTK